MDSEGQKGRTKTKSAKAVSLQAGADARDETWHAMIQQRVEKDWRALKRRYGNKVQDGGRR